MLESVTQIIPPEWMQASEARAVMAALQAEKDKPAALFVGGCVRNAVLGEPVTDVDIATTLLPEETIAALEKAGIKAVPTGIDHGTVTAVTDKKSFEITSLRRDVETDGRRAVVAFTTDWGEDAQRRDFTINTLLADGAGNIYDPTGQGWADLQARRVVFVGAPAERIAEDILRILRFFRFWARYGEGAPDEAALSACRAAASQIQTLSRERITQEFLKILALPDPEPVLSLMLENGVLADLPAAGYDPVILTALSGLQEQAGAIAVVPRLIVLAAFMASALEKLEEFLILTNKQKKYFHKLIDMISAIDRLDEKTVKVFIYHYGASETIQSVLLFEAWQDEMEEGEIINLVDLARTWQAPSFPVTGQDLIKAGVSQGPALGEALAALEQWWIDQDFSPDRAACLAQLSTAI